MPRLPRVIVPGVPVHITQRGVDHCPTFITPDDYAFYRWALHEAGSRGGCHVHAYVLMTNHIHLLVTPGDSEAPARMMRVLGALYVRYFNDRYRRTGTLWEGRFRSAVVDSAAYLFACSRYIEMNPVRAGIAVDPSVYEWSSFHRNATGLSDPIIVEHAQYTALGSTREIRCLAYRGMFATPMSADAVATVRSTQRARSKLHPTSYQEAIRAVLGSGEGEPSVELAGSGRAGRA